MPDIVTKSPPDAALVARKSPYRPLVALESALRGEVGGWPAGVALGALVRPALLLVFVVDAAIFFALVKAHGEERFQFRQVQRRNAAASLRASSTVAVTIRNAVPFFFLQRDRQYGRGGAGSQGVWAPLRNHPGFSKFYLHGHPAPCLISERLLDKKKVPPGQRAAYSPNHMSSYRKIPLRCGVIKIYCVVYHQWPTKAKEPQRERFHSHERFFVKTKQNKMHF